MTELHPLGSPELPAPQVGCETGNQPPSKANLCSSLILSCRIFHSDEGVNATTPPPNKRTRFCCAQTSKCARACSRRAAYADNLACARTRNETADIGGRESCQRSRHGAKQKRRNRYQPRTGRFQVGRRRASADDYLFFAGNRPAAHARIAGGYERQPEARAAG